MSNRVFPTKHSSLWHSVTVRVCIYTTLRFEPTPLAVNMNSATKVQGTCVTTLGLCQHTASEQPHEQTQKSKANPSVVFLFGHFPVIAIRLQLL